MNQQALSSFIWSVADLLRGDYKQSEYGRVILPFTVLRCLDCVLAGTNAAAMEVNERGNTRRNLVLNSLAPGEFATFDGATDTPPVSLQRWGPHLFRAVHGQFPGILPECDVSDFGGCGIAGDRYVDKSDKLPSH